MNLAFIIRRLFKTKALRIVNLLGLSVIFACMALSFFYVRYELSYDRFNENADRIARLSIQYGEEPIDGRLYAPNIQSEIKQIPEIEEMVCLTKVNTSVLTYQNKPRVINDLYYASPNFFEVFSYSLITGNSSTILKSPESTLVSESLARELFGYEDPIGKEITLEGRKLDEKTYVVSGVFHDFPKNSHFHTDLILHRPDDHFDWTYVYFLFREKEGMNQVEQRITDYYNGLNGLDEVAYAHLTPPTDIHLHSRVQREMEPNGNIHYIYLITGANILLLLVVLFNLWLNSSLLFSFNKRYYQLLRLNGAPLPYVFYYEIVSALILGVLSILLGGVLAYYAVHILHFPLSALFSTQNIVLSIGFLAMLTFVSLLPVITEISSTLFHSSQDNIKPQRFSFTSNIKYAIIAQYAAVMFIVIVAFGISKQLNLIKTEQVGGNEQNILVMDEQPDAVNQNYNLLKTELLKHPEIENVTNSFQLPGSAIRDALTAKLEGSEESKLLPILIVGEDFFSFYNLKPIAGRVFNPIKLTYNEESDRMIKHLWKEPLEYGFTEEYMLNLKAMEIVGFKSPDEAIGKTIEIQHPALGYINKGTVCGITDNFTYVSMYEDSIPMFIIQRQMFLHCTMVKFAPGKREEGLVIFNKIWNQVNPDYPANYSFLQDVFGKVYRDEINAGRLISIFSLLCLIVANLGLIIFMAFIIKRKHQEIAIRKVNGATTAQIIRMLNMNFIRWIAIAYLIAVPVAYYAIKKWLENFAHRTSLDWWVFILAGAVVLLISIISISWQSWRAASANPAKALKME